MKQSNKELIEDLICRTKENIKQAEEFKTIETALLNQKPGPEKWSILECLEHLNFYGNFYLPEIENRLKKAPVAPANSQFKSGLLGNYFAKSLLPKEKLNKMKTFKEMNPNGSKLSRNVVDTFLAQQAKTLELLEQARTVNLTKAKTSISISKWIKLRLGDTFRLVIYHNQRHIEQATKVLN